MLPFGEAWTGSLIHKRSDTLLSDDGFETLLREESLVTMPRALAGRLDRRVER